MKFFTLIFSIYILALSFQPCDEMTANADVRVDAPSQQAQLQTGEKDVDDCSPFCICSCCHFSVAYQFKTFSVTNKSIVSALSIPNFFYRNPDDQVYKNSVWQPPKV